MVKMTIETNQIEALKAILQSHEHNRVRMQALALILKSQNISYETIKNITGLCENTVRNYCKEYDKEGIESVSLPDFRKPASKLVPHEEAIKKYLEETPPSSVSQACKEIEALTGVKLKNTQMRKYLNSVGAKFRKVCGIPAKANPAEQKEFLENKLNPRLKEAEEATRTVYFIDAAHFVLGAFLGYVWSFARVFIKTPSGRQRFNVLGALNAVTKELISVTNDTYITSTQVCELLESIALKAVQNVPITVVLDNARYQRCDAVIECATKLNIELLFLPTYSPNLNLIERVWKFTKKQCLNSKYYSSFKPFKDTISDFLINMHSKCKSELESLLTLKFQMFTEEQLYNAG